MARHRAPLSYAPELNPVELLWGNLQAGELASLCVDTIAEMELAANQGIARMQGENDFALSFLRHTGLSL